jgi:hypothetical protein
VTSGSRVGRLLCVALLTAPLFLTGPPGSAADPSPEPTPTAAPAPSASHAVDPAPLEEPGCTDASEETPVQVEVTTLLPRAPMRADEPFQVAGRLRNCGKQALQDLQVGLAVGRVIRTRGELQRADSEPVVGTRRLTREPGESTLAPGETTTFDLRLLVSDLGLRSSLGVYPLAVQARARYGDDRGVTPVGLATTFVPWFPDGPPAPTRVAWLWPLVDQPRRAPAEVMLDDELDALVAAGDGSTPRGRLQELLVGAREGSRGGCDPTAAPPPGVAREPSAGCRGEPVPMTYGVDPSLLYSIEAMTRPTGYSVLVDGQPVDRPPSRNAEQWLAAMRAAAAESDVLALPFGDPDVVAMSRPGTDLRDDVEQLRKLGQAEARELLSVEPLTSAVWPPPGPVPSAAQDALVGGQARAVVLDVAALPPASPLRNRTPSARHVLPSQFGKVTGLVVEDVLSDLVAPQTAGWQGARLAEQRFLAETAIIAAEVPSQSRTLLVAPDRDARVVPAVAAAVIADTGRLPWLCPVPLADVVAGRERCRGLPDEQGPAPAEERSEPDLPEGRADELSRDFLERLATVRAAADQFTQAVLVDGTENSARTQARLLRAHGRAASAAWRNQPRMGRRMLTLLEDDVELLRNQVRLVSRPVLLTGDSGVLQLLVQNELDQPVNVGVRLDETGAARLSSSATGVQVIPARNATQVSVRVEPRTSGRFRVFATLVDEDGRPFGEPVALDVRSTRYGRVALAVTGVAAAVLLVAVGVRITRRALRRRPDGEAG